MRLPEGQRVVIVDPGHASDSGHHAELNHQLLQVARSAGLAIEFWVDQTCTAADAAYRPVFLECGYVDPRHWLDLPGTLHLASRLHEQLLRALQAAGDPPVACWIGHSLLPFQLIGLARLLQHQPAARVELGILYAPAERLGGSTHSTAISPDPLRERELAIANARLSWSGLARAVQTAGHTLRLGCSSQLQVDLHQPLLAAAGLPQATLQPAVVGAGWQPGGQVQAHEPVLQAEEPPLVLLHWGDLKAGKGLQQVLSLLEALLAREGEPLPPWRWLFHHCSRIPLSSQDQQLLRRAEQHLPGFLLWQGAVSTEVMQRALALTDVAFLPYCPVAYSERSSGVLWCYGAARLATGSPARAVGFSGGWLASEATALGLGWQGLAADTASPDAWLAAIDQALRASAPAFSDYGLQVLGRSYAQWLLADLHSCG